MSAATSYADRKAGKLDTEARCREKGIRFFHGGGNLRRVERRGTAFIKSSSNQTNDLAAAHTAVSKTDASRALFQRLSVSLMRENAQTLLDRQQQQSVEDRLDFRTLAQRDTDLLTAQVDRDERVTAHVSHAPNLEPHTSPRLRPQQSRSPTPPRPSPSCSDEGAAATMPLSPPTLLPPAESPAPAQ